MKRYRVLSYDFDTRANILSQEIGEHWEDGVKQQWQANKVNVRQGLIFQYGQFNSDIKISNFVDIGMKPFSILAFHNKFLSQSRDAFTMGAYYPALTGACALGERILNHLILLLRNDYKNSAEYRYVYRKDSFDNWNIVIDALTAWNVLLPDCTDDFRKLSILRNQSIHFNPDTDTNDRQTALDAIILIQKIIDKQFGSFGTQSWFIQTIPGEAYIKKSWENQPFIKKVYIPNCDLVGPKHSLKMENGRWEVLDDYIYQDKEISDEEFSALRVNRKQ